MLGRTDSKAAHDPPLLRKFLVAGSNGYWLVLRLGVGRLMAICVIVMSIYIIRCKCGHDNM